MYSFSLASAAFLLTTNVLLFCERGSLSSINSLFVNVSKKSSPYVHKLFICDHASLFKLNISISLFPKAAISGSLDSTQITLPFESYYVASSAYMSKAAAIIASSFIMSNCLNELSRSCASVRNLLNCVTSINDVPSNAFTRSPNVFGSLVNGNYVFFVEFGETLNLIFSNKLAILSPPFILYYYILIKAKKHFVHTQFRLAHIWEREGLVPPLLPLQPKDKDLYSKDHTQPIFD